MCTHTIAFTPRQYLSHMERNRGWPPRSQLESVSRTFSLLLVAAARDGKPFECNMSFLDALHVEAYGWY
jgi:hypothetical protein